MKNIRNRKWVVIVTSILIVIGLYSYLDKRLFDKEKLKDIPANLADSASKYNIFIGSAVNHNLLTNDQQYKELLKDQFNIITTENEMKFDIIHPQKYKYDFEQADTIVDFAEENKLKVRGHTLVWHQRIPEWVNKEAYSKEEMKKILKEHIQTVVGKYKGKVYAWDVVNEALYEDGSLRESIWLKTIGPEYIKLAFQWAHEADPDALLFFNDFNILVSNQKSEGLYNLIKDYKKEGIPINGIGMQMHITTDSDLDFEKMLKNINRFNDLGLEVQITELDVSLEKANNEKESTEIINTQSDIYSNALKVCMNAKNCTGFIMWGILDKYSPRETFQYPLIYDNNYRPKKAYWSLYDTLENTN